MPVPIGTFSPEAIIGLIEESLVDASVVLGRSEEGVVFRGSDVTWVYTGYPALSRVLNARFAPDEAEDRVGEIADCFRDWAAPVTWIIGPSSYPPHLGEIVRAAGFRPDTAWLGMARDLSPVPDADPPAGLTVERATSKPDLAAWAAMGDGAAGPGAASGAVADLFAPENAGGDPRCRYYLAHLGGRPVARGLAFAGEEAVGLYWITADPAHRGHHYERAVAVRALADARETGARLAVIATRVGYESMGEQLGFRPYCQFHSYAWPPAAAGNGSPAH